MPLCSMRGEVARRLRSTRLRLPTRVRVCAGCCSGLCSSGAVAPHESCFDQSTIPLPYDASGNAAAYLTAVADVHTASRTRS
eukprot:2752967-Prymnesium_polylepis.1